MVADFLFLLALLSIPIQLGKFFFFNYSYILGIPIDYRASAIYLSDLLIIAYIVAFTGGNLQDFKKIFKLRKRFLKAIFFLNLYLLIDTLFFSLSKQVSLYLNLKTLEFGLFALCCSLTLAKKKILKRAYMVMAFSLIWQALVVFGQFIFQRSLGLWFLGERTFDTTTVGIAHSQIFGNQYLRPYGTFPHPNVLGGFFVVFLIILLSDYLKIKKNTKSKNYFWSKAISIGLLAVATMLTFSKSAALSAVLAFIVFAKRFKDLLIRLVAALVLLLIVIQSLSSVEITSIAERLTLAQAAFDVAKLNPLFGVGSGNFILELSKFDLFTISQVRLLQPVHNIFLLVLAENGILGVLLFSFVLLVVFRQAVSNIKIALFIVILIYLSVDHFFVTLQQGQFLFWFTLAYIISSPNKSTS